MPTPFDNPRTCSRCVGSCIDLTDTGKVSVECDETIDRVKPVTDIWLTLLLIGRSSRHEESKTFRQPTGWFVMLGVSALVFAWTKRRQ